MRPFAPLRWLACIFALVATLGFAADATVIHFDIPADTAAAAVKVFARQSGSEVIIRSDKDGLVKTNAVRGDLTVAAALDVMLKDTGLVADRHIKTGAYAIRSETEAESKNVARAIVETDARPSGKFETDSNGEKVLKLDTFEVFGRKTLNMDIQRTRDDVQPYITFDRAAIKGSGANNLEDFLRARLTVNTQRGTASQSSSNGSDLPTINLRGMGVNQTLILVDGRRLPRVNGAGINPSSRIGLTAASDFGQSDINSIPLGAIERIEVLPASAGGIYGGGATAGVINIVLRRSYSGIQMTASYGNTYDAASEIKQFYLNIGRTLLDGRLRLMLNYAHQESSPLLAGKRSYLLIQRPREITLSANPTSIISPNAAPPIGYTPNIRAAVPGQSLVLDTGTPLNSYFTSVPIGYSGVASDGGAALAARAGIYSLDPANDASSGIGLKSAASSRPIVDSFDLNLRGDILSKLEGYADIQVGKNRSEVTGQIGAVSNNQIRLPAAAINNPFQQDVLVTFSTPNLNPKPSSTTSTTSQLNVGLIAKLPKEWLISVDSSFGESEIKFETNAIAGGLLTSAGSAALTNGTLDVMRDVNAYPVDYNAYLSSVTPPYSYSLLPGKTRSRDYTLRFSGNVIGTSSFELVTAGYAEFRDERAEPSVRILRNTLATATATFFGPRSQRVFSCYAELRAKISNLAPAIPVQDIELQASFRNDDYSSKATTPTSQNAAFSGTIGSFTTTGEYRNAQARPSYTLGAKFNFKGGIALRGSVGTGFMPPSVAQLVPGSSIQLTPSSLLNASTLDPKRGNSPVIADATGGLRTDLLSVSSPNNPTLRPELSTSYSTGLIYTPPRVPGLRLSIDYSRIKKTDEITSIQTTDLIALEDNLRGRITRGANLPGDLPGWAGPITGIDVSLANVAYSSVEAFDFQADYALTTSWGKVSFYGVATQQTHLQRRLNPSLPSVERAGYLDGPLKFKANGGINASVKQWDIGVNVQYYGKYSIYSSTNIGNPAVLQAAGGRAIVPAQHYWDVNLRYRFDEGVWKAARNASIALGMSNILNTLPPYDGTIYSGYGDPRLRRFVITIEKQL